MAAKHFLGTKQKGISSKLFSFFFVFLFWPSDWFRFCNVTISWTRTTSIPVTAPSTPTRRGCSQGLRRRATRSPPPPLVLRRLHLTGHSRPVFYGAGEPQVDCFPGDPVFVSAFSQEVLLLSRCFISVFFSMFFVSCVCCWWWWWWCCFSCCMIRSRYWFRWQMLLSGCYILEAQYKYVAIVDWTHMLPLSLLCVCLGSAVCSSCCWCCCCPCRCLVNGLGVRLFQSLPLLLLLLIDPDRRCCCRLPSSTPFLPLTLVLVFFFCFRSFVPLFVSVPLLLLLLIDRFPTSRGSSRSSSWSLYVLLSATAGPRSAPPGHRTRPVPPLHAVHRSRHAAGP